MFGSNKARGSKLYPKKDKGKKIYIVMTFLVRECYGSPKISIKFVKIRQNLLKFTPEECYDKVLNEEF